jgi:molybdenum cofactor synthesis domain-containing protein
MPEASSPKLVTSAAALLIGNELLSGKVRDSNLFELARTLRARGVRLQRVVMVEDDVDVISHEVSELSSAFDVVFTSGGVGPTHDDVTMAAVAKAFGVSTSIDPTLAAQLRDHYGGRCSDDHLRMALVPDGARLAATAEMPWPTVVMHNVWILPGVPEVFRMKLSVVRSSLRGAADYYSRAAFTRVEEADLKPLLDRVVAEHPDVQVGSYPKWFDPEYQTQVTFDGHERGAVEAALHAFLDLLGPAQLARTQ